MTGPRFEVSPNRIALVAGDGEVIHTFAEGMADAPPSSSPSSCECCDRADDLAAENTRLCSELDAYRATRTLGGPSPTGYPRLVFGSVSGSTAGRLGRNHRGGDVTEPTYNELTLESGTRCRVWIHPDWFVMEVNGMVSHTQRKNAHDHSPDSQADLRGYAEALMAATC